MMSGLNPAHPAMFFLLIFFSIASFKLSHSSRNNDIVLCPEIEKQSLLSFKQSLKDPDNLLSSWDDEMNCCKWKGVVCNNFTGHVHQLYLRNISPLFQGLSGKINPSLLNLKYLRYLDLSQNNFTETIPSFVGSFTKLEYLNLSFAGFHGKIPHNIGNLSNLHTLDLATYVLDVDSLEWLLRLPRLEHLNMNGADLSKATNWAQVINALPSLLQLNFGDCNLDFAAPLNDDVNISTSLTFLDLSANVNSSIQSFAIPRWVFQSPNLIFLDLSHKFFGGPIQTISNAIKLQYIDLHGNYLNSSIPDWLYLCKNLEVIWLRVNHLEGTISNAVANLTSLNALDLSFNKLSGKMPKEIANLCKIRLLHLSFNNLQGEISDSFGNMSECFLGTLESLLLGRNQLSGHLTDQFGEFKSLQSLNLVGNSLSGAIPFNIGKLSSLRDLVLYGNKFTGKLPESLGQLLNLQVLDITDNMLEGVVTESHFANLTNLWSISASGNHLTLNVSPNWTPPFQLSVLSVGSWKLGIGSQVKVIPSWLETQKKYISSLDLSDTGISGSVPSWFWKVQFLNLSHNYLHGQIPYIFLPQSVYLSSNQFNGSLPRISHTMEALDLSNNSFSGGISHFLCDRAHDAYGLGLLHLGGNKLSGELPDCWMKWSLLFYLNLGNNNMSGTIPNSIGSLVILESLNLYGNKFSGQVPFSLHHCTNLEKIDVADNYLDGNIPTWIGTSLVVLRVLILRSNKLSGKISSEICSLNSLHILDLSGNNLSGAIPRCVYNFTAMANKSNVHTPFYHPSNYPSLWKYWSMLESASIATKGRVLEYDTILPLVTDIDISRNNLSGDIPKELTSLVELRSLNLSGNHLTGLIPDSIGDMKQLESLDFSRNSLSGQIPKGFALISSLNYLNLSYNNLTGEIPESTQLQSLDASSFVGNNLCGPPLTSSCSHDGDEKHGDKGKNEDEVHKPEIEWFYVFLFLGHAVGFSIVCTTLVLKKSWREACFELLQCMWDKIYVYMYIKWTKLTKLSSPSL